MSVAQWLRNLIFPPHKDERLVHVEEVVREMRKSVDKLPAPKNDLSDTLDAVVGRFQ